MDLYIKFIFGIIASYGIVVFNFALFKVRVSGKDKQIMILALVLGVANYYFKFVEDSSIFFVSQVVVYTIAMTIIRNYPLLYALALCGIGIITAGIVDVVVTGSVISLNLATLEQINNNTIPFAIIHSVFAVICLLVARVFIKYKIGFGFVVRKFSGRNTLRASTFVWAFVLMLGLGTLQFISQNYKLFSQGGISVIVAAVSLNVCVVYAYFQNKKSLIDRFGEAKEVG